MHLSATLFNTSADRENAECNETLEPTSTTGTIDLPTQVNGMAVSSGYLRVSVAGPNGEDTAAEWRF